MAARSLVRDETVVSIVDGYVANALAGPNNQPFWAEGYASAIRWVRRAHRLAGDQPPTIDRIATVVARPVELVELVARAAPDSEGVAADVDPQRVELLRWHRRDWLALDAGLRRGIAEGLRLAADTPVATRVLCVDGVSVHRGPEVGGVQPLKTETLYFGAWTGEGPRWDGWLIEPAAAAGLRVAGDATGTIHLPGAAAGSAQPSASASVQGIGAESAPHGYKVAMRLVVDLQGKADLAVRAARAAGAECGRDRSERGRDLSSVESLASRLREVQSALVAAAEVAAVAAADITAKSVS